MPLKIIERALGTSAAGTKRIATAAAIAQKPPRATPNNVRMTSSTIKLEEKATNKLEITIKNENASNTHRLSKDRVRPGKINPEHNAATAVTVTVWPATASDTPSSEAIGVRRLAGKYSDVNNPKTPIVRENTAVHAGAVGPPLLEPEGAASILVTTLHLLLPKFKLSIKTNLLWIKSRF